MVDARYIRDDALEDVVEIQDAEQVAGLIREALDVRNQNIGSAAHWDRVQLALEAALAYVADSEDLEDWTSPDNKEITGQTDVSQASNDGIVIQNEDPNSRSRRAPLAMGLNGPTEVKAGEHKAGGSFEGGSGEKGGSFSKK